MGPTASGKTDLALRAADRFAVRLISVDSAMVYRQMDIGTGKPDPHTLARYPHALVDLLDPRESYSAGQFRADALGEIERAIEKRQVPVLVGGTMLYFRALQHGLAELPAAQPSVRASIDAEAAIRGWPALHADLGVIDPVAARRIQPNDSQRVQRALEVYRITGRTLSELHAEARTQTPPYRFHVYAWSPIDREQLYQRIEHRFMQMMDRGLLDEVRKLFDRGDLNSQLPSMRSVGYRQLWEHLAGGCSLHEGVRQAILATRHLARRQLIWLRAIEGLHWLDALEPTAADEIYKCIATASRRLVNH